MRSEILESIHFEGDLSETQIMCRLGSVIRPIAKLINADFRMLTPIRGEFFKKVDWASEIVQEVPILGPDNFQRIVAESLKMFQDKIAMHELMR